VEISVEETTAVQCEVEELEEEVDHLIQPLASLVYIYIKP